MQICITRPQGVKKILCMSWGTSNSITLTFCLFYNFDPENSLYTKKSTPNLDGSKVDEL